jgi:hypothetical protein
MLLKTMTVVGTGESNLANDNNRVNTSRNCSEPRGDLANFLLAGVADQGKVFGINPGPGVRGPYRLTEEADNH